jgi:ABC-type microcin C transport system permease subunit YejB
VRKKYFWLTLLVIIVVILSVAVTKNLITKNSFGTELENTIKAEDNALEKLLFVEVIDPYMYAFYKENQKVSIALQENYGKKWMF